MAEIKMLKIDIESMFVNLIGIRYYVRGTYTASIFGSNGILQIYLFWYVITIQLPWKHTIGPSRDTTIHWGKISGWVFRKWGYN